MRRHKYADLICAWSNGAKIQLKSRLDNDLWHDVDNPNWNPDREWRIKPVPEAQWKQKLRQAAREGERIEFFCGKWAFSDLNVNPDSHEFGNSCESDYRIVPKKVTRWLWVYKEGNQWVMHPQYMTIREAFNTISPKPNRCLDFTAQELEE